VGRVLGYTTASQVILYSQEEPDIKLALFFEADPLKTDGVWFVLLSAQPRTGNRVFVLRGQYAGLMGRIVRL
jgi:hypothetical protein